MIRITLALALLLSVSIVPSTYAQEPAVSVAADCGDLRRALQELQVPWANVLKAIWGENHVVLIFREIQRVGPMPGRLIFVTGDMDRDPYRSVLKLTELGVNLRPDYCKLPKPLSKR